MKQAYLKVGGDGWPASLWPVKGQGETEEEALAPVRARLKTLGHSEDAIAAWIAAHIEVKEVEMGPGH